MSLKLTTYRLGEPRTKGEGLRIGTVRYLPRGVKKEDYARLDYFDVWLPILAPSGKAVSKYKNDYEKNPDKIKTWKKFSDTYRREMTKDTNARQSILLLSELAKHTPVAIGCFCEDETLCHRQLLFELITEQAKSENG